MVLTLSNSAFDCAVAKIECFVPAEGSYYDLLKLVLARDPGVRRETAESLSECRVCTLT